MFESLDEQLKLDAHKSTSNTERVDPLGFRDRNCADRLRRPLLGRPNDARRLSRGIPLLRLLEPRP